MKKGILLIAVLCAGPAYAGWEKVGESDEIVFYIDPQTIRKDGNYRRVWGIQELKSRGEDGEFSRRSQMEFDCKNETQRLLDISTYSEKMISGKAIFSSAVDRKPLPVLPGTASESMMKIVCVR